MTERRIDRHARACPAHPQFTVMRGACPAHPRLDESKSWVAGTSLDKPGHDGGGEFTVMRGPVPRVHDAQLASAAGHV